MALRDLFEEVLDLGASYSPSGNPAMDRRQAALGEACEVFAGWLGSLAPLVSSDPIELDVQAGGRIANFGPVPWVRIFSKAHSPRTTTGYYLVYLFAADGSAVYLSLNQGTSEFRAAKWRPVTDASELLARAQAGRGVLADWDSEVLRSGWVDIDLAVDAVDVGAESKRRVRNYEMANVIAVPYLAGELPPDDVMFADLCALAPLLGGLYGESPAAPPSSGPAGTGKGQGRRMDTAARIAIEDHAMAAASAYYTDLGWDVENVSRSKSFDLLCRRGEEELHVEVKGTTSAGHQVTITRLEMKHALSGAPTALLVLREIELTYHDDGTRTAAGGWLQVIDPWKLEPERLVVIDYQYSVRDHP